MSYAFLAVFLLLTGAAASFGALYKPGDWYVALAKPTWTPPGWLFAPVWTALYVMIAVAGWLVWRNEAFGATGTRRAALTCWGVQLMLNAAWSWLMFGQHRIGMALADLIGMWLAIVGFAIFAWRVSEPAALLFLPYLAWVSFAGVLNAAILRLNP